MGQRASSDFLGTVETMLNIPKWKPFNEAQLSTVEQARALLALINATNFARPGDSPTLIGGGVLPESERNDLSGIYIPDDFYVAPINSNATTWPLPGTSQPDDPETGAHNICLRFVNGAQGFNVGLIVDRLRKYPSAPYYVLNQLRLEVDAFAADLHHR